MPFKTCPNCFYVWPDRDSFLSDPRISAMGYQVNFDDLTAGFFLFNHTTCQCGTSLALEAGQFTDMHDGPIFQERLNGTSECPQYCLHDDSLEPCPEKCECAYVLDVLQKVKSWPKRAEDTAGLKTETGI